MQLVSKQQHQYQLAVTVSGSDQIAWVEINDAAATEAVLAGRFAAMHVERAGKCRYCALWYAMHCLCACLFSVKSCAVFIAQHQGMKLSSPTSSKTLRLHLAQLGVQVH